MKTNIIAEIGINHKGSLDIAKKLIREACDAGCWGVKFQYRHLESFYASSNEIGDGIILEELQRVSFSVNEFIELATYCKRYNLKIGVSFFRVRDFLEFKKAIGYFDFFKIPSAECTNIPLLQQLLETNKTIMVSTGGHDLHQIEKNLLKYKDKIVIFHCIANYPLKLGSQNLNFINKLKDMGFKEVGYSSHDEDVDVCLLALGMKINWIERHLTEDINGLGLDDSSSSEINDFKKIIKYSSLIDSIFGPEIKTLNQGEILNMQNLGTGLYAKNSIEKGKKVIIEDFEIKAPRTGISVGDFINKFEGKRLNFDLKKDSPLQISAFNKKIQINVEPLAKKASTNKVGIPVRLHDFKKLRKNIPLSCYEFHLSYQESMSNDFLDALQSIENDDFISIHLPDYIPGNKILDPISNDLETRNLSHALVRNITNFADSIRNKIGKDVPIVGSFSQNNFSSRDETLDMLFNFLDSKDFVSFNILPQWLPVYAWYFGGAVKLDLFNSPADIDYLIRNNRKICLDLCHLALSSKYAGVDWKDWFDLLIPLSPHFHFADSIGVDGEGLQLGSGDIGDFKRFLKYDGLKIIEVWQGHLNEGEGFVNALIELFD